jgi:hypothetical protein
VTSFCLVLFFIHKNNGTDNSVISITGKTKKNSKAKIILPYSFTLNAKHNGLMKLAAFLSIFSKKMTALTSPIDASCYVIVALHN